MNDCTTYQNRDRHPRFVRGRIIQKSCLIAGIIFLTLHPNIVRSQSIPSDGVGNSSPNFDNLSPGQFNNIRPIRQPNFYPDSGGAQQFFRQSNDLLYFLPVEKSDPILKIDKTIEAEEIEKENLPQKGIEEFDRN